MIEPVTNDRLMVGMGAAMSGWQRWLLLALVGGSLTVLLVRQWRGLQVRTVVAAMFFAGVLGNAGDRFLLGAVRDWLRIGPIIVNAADLYLLMSILVITSAGISTMWRPETAPAPRRSLDSTAPTPDPRLSDGDAVNRTATDVPASKVNSWVRSTPPDRCNTDADTPPDLGRG